jgi:hypothetical protein
VVRGRGRLGHVRGHMLWHCRGSVGVALLPGMVVCLRGCLRSVLRVLRALRRVAVVLLLLLRGHLRHVLSHLRCHVLGVLSRRRTLHRVENGVGIHAVHHGLNLNLARTNSRSGSRPSSGHFGHYRCRKRPCCARHGRRECTPNGSN